MAKVIVDSTAPVFVHFGDHEVAAYLGYKRRHSQAVQALLALSVGAYSPIYCAYSLVWEMSTESPQVRRALKVLHTTGQLLPYTEFADPDLFLRTRVNYFSHVRDEHPYFFGKQADAIARQYHSPGVKRLNTVATIESFLRQWAQERSTKYIDDRLSGIIREGFSRRAGEALTIDLFIQKLGISRSDPEIRAINLAIIQSYVQVYLSELHGTIVSGLDRCGQIDQAFDYFANLDFVLLSRIFELIFGRDIFRHAPHSLDAAAMLRSSGQQVALTEQISSLIAELLRITFERPDLRLETMEQVRSRLISLINRFLSRNTHAPNNISEAAYTMGTELLASAIERAKASTGRVSSYRLMSGEQRDEGLVNSSTGSFTSILQRAQILDVPRRQIDVGLITVIGPELNAVLDLVRQYSNPELEHANGSTYWRAHLYSRLLQRDLSISIHCIGSPGNAAAAIATERLINLKDPRFVCLVGISAGRRGATKMGDVVIPRAVVDYTLRVALKGREAARPTILDLPYGVSQMIRAWRQESDQWRSRCREALASRHVVVRELDSFSLTVHEAAIASGDILLRDGDVLERLRNQIHEQIRVGEMEAGGFVRTCNSRAVPLPWLVVRGVSDYGDAAKDDSFHQLASYSAASFLIDFLETGLDLRNLE